MKVIAHVDMDAFYTQVEIGRDPERLSGQPVVVIQYNPFGDLSTLRPDEDRIKPESNGSIIAVSYEARKFGVKRNMMAQQAKKVCPTLQIVQVPVAHGKADLTIYRDAGAAVINVLSKSAVCERASIDEAYLGVTAAAQQLLASAKERSSNSSPGSTTDPPRAAAAAAEASGGVAGAEGEPDLDDGAKAQRAGVAGDAGPALQLPCPESFEGWHVAGVEPEGIEALQQWWSRPSSEWDQSDALLAAGAWVVARARAAVKATLGYSCSAGIAHSKILAKLGSGLHKPAQQTVVPAAAVGGLLAPLPVSKLRQLGGKFGEEVMAKFQVTTVGELAAIPLPRLESVLGAQDAAWLHRLAQGKDGEDVKPRMLPKSISCGKTFRGQNVLTGLTAVHKWLLQLGEELQERIEADRQQHQRLPKLLTVSFDSAPLEDGSSEAAPAAAAAAGTEGVSSRGGGSNSTGPSHGRLNVQNWRSGATNISRSCTLRHARADAVAADALGLVKKWARDRPNGFRIVTMFISASNFSLAPTGASTLERFFTAPAAAPAATAPAAAASASAAVAEVPSNQQQQQQQDVEATAGAGGGGSSAERAGTTKRPAAGRLWPSRGSKAARTDKQQGDLRLFLATVQPAPSLTAAAAGGTGLSAAAAAVAAGSDMAVGAGGGLERGADSDADLAGNVMTDRGDSVTGRSEGRCEGEESDGVIVVSDSQGVSDDADPVKGAFDDLDYSDTAAAAAGWASDMEAVRALAAAAAAVAGGTAAAGAAAAAAAVSGVAASGPFAPPKQLPGYKARSPAKPALSALQLFQFPAHHNADMQSATAAELPAPAGQHGEQVAWAAAAAVLRPISTASPAAAAEAVACREGTGQPISRDGVHDTVPVSSMQGSDLSQAVPSLHAWLGNHPQGCADPGASLPAQTQGDREQLHLQDCQQAEGFPEQAQDAACAGGQQLAVPPATADLCPAGSAQQAQADTGLALHAQRAGAQSSQQQCPQDQQLDLGVSLLQADGDTEQGLLHAQHQLQDSGMQDAQWQDWLVLRQSAQQAVAQVGHAQDEHAQMLQQPAQGQQLAAQQPEQQGCQLQDQQAQLPQRPAQQLEQQEPAQQRGPDAWVQQPMRLSDIDPDVLASLPWEIQQQLRANRAGGTVRSSAQPSRRGRGDAAGRASTGSGRRQQQQRHGSIHKYLSK